MSKEYIGGLVQCPCSKVFIIAKNGRGIVYPVTITSQENGLTTQVTAMGSQGTVSVANNIEDCTHNQVCGCKINECWHLKQ